MPYIIPKTRADLEPSIEQLVEKLIGHGDGAVNYAVTRIVDELFSKGETYTDCERAIGLLECIKLEYVRRRLYILEDLKRKENGEVYL